MFVHVRVCVRVCVGVCIIIVDHFKKFSPTKEVFVSPVNGSFSDFFLIKGCCCCSFICLIIYLIH